VSLSYKALAVPSNRSHNEFNFLTFSDLNFLAGALEAMSPKFIASHFINSLRPCSESLISSTLFRLGDGEREEVGGESEGGPGTVIPKEIIFASIILPCSIKSLYGDIFISFGSSSSGRARIPAYSSTTTDLLPVFKFL
jgi:hypothetical protein